MSQSASGQSSVHPVLQAALGSLDMSFELELARYRHQRSVSGSGSAAVNQSQAPPEIDASVPNAAANQVVGVSLSQAAAASELDSLVEESSYSNLTLGLGTADLRAMVAEEARGFGAREYDEFLELTDSLLHHPEDYLESSEALVRNLEAPEATSPALQSLRNRRWGGWGMAAVAVLGGTVGIAYLIFKGVESQKAAVPSTPAIASPTEPGVVSGPSAALPSAPSQPAIAPSPDLSAEEFVDLNLSNLSRAQPVPATPPAAPGPLSPTVPPNPSSAGASQTRFYVLAPYQNPADLGKARRLVPTAYLVQVPEGTQIQMGVFTDLAMAEKLLDSLKRQGISGRIRRTQ